MKKRLLLFFLSAVMILSNVTVPALAASKEDLKRTVYLHSTMDMGYNASVPIKENKADGEAVAGKEVGVRLAVDKPNKGDTRLNGYFIKLYYDPNVLTLKGNSVKSAFDYKYGFSEDDENFKFYQLSSGGFTSIGISNLDGLQKTENIGGKTYNVISAALFYSGLELTDKDNESWYDILGISFIANANVAGKTTDVFIDTGAFNETDSGFCLFAKHRKEGEGDGEKYFNTTILNGGRHTIRIKENEAPPAPIINMPTGSYSPQALSTGSVTITAEAGCDIWYTTDAKATDYPTFDEYGNETSGKYIKVSGNEFTYDKPVDETTTLKAVAVRSTETGDIKTSYATIRTYRIIPNSPSLFYDKDGEKNRINPPYYSDNKPFDVWLDDGIEYDGRVNDVTRVYYTFSLNDETEVLNIDYTDTSERNPKNGWVMINPNDMDSPINIKENCNIRIVTRIKDELSGVTEYALSILPPPALVKEESQKPTNPQQAVDVELICENSLAEIYYTLDGSDPRTGNGILYRGDAIPIRNNENGGVVLTTVAKYDGVYSELTTYKYDFGITSYPWVKALPPSGEYYGEIKVQLTSTNADDEIYYTFDLSKDPKTVGELYDRQPITINEDTAIKAVAKDKDGNYSDIQTFFYYVRPKAPVFRPETTQFSESGNVTIHSEYDGQDGYQLWITTNGDDPRTTTGDNVIKADGSYYNVENIDKYTEIKAVVAKKSGDKWILSDLVTHTYDVVVSRPAKPVPTLVPGTYTITADMDGYSTSFVPMGDDIKIYYSVSSSQESPYPPDDPIGEQYLWDGSPIPIKGETIVKAVAEDSFGVRSQIGVFYYNIVPEKPVAPASTTYTDMEFIPVTVVEGSDFTYTINGVTHIVPKENMQNRTKVYIDAKTGLAYSDEAKTERIDSGDEQNITSPIALDMYCEKDGVKSGTASYKYTLDTKPSAPFVVKNPGGEYPQKKQDGTDAYIVVELGALEKDKTIEYCIGSENIDDPNAWKPYPANGIEIYDDCELYARVKDKNSNVSDMITEIYNFHPLPPVITPASGTYSDDVAVTIKFDDDAAVPNGSSYIIKYSVNGEISNEAIYPGQEKKLTVSQNAAVKAWVVETDGKTGDEIDRSEAVINYYFINKTAFGTGKAQFGEPFDTRNIFAAWEIKNISGIQLKSSPPGYTIKYQYKYTDTDGVEYNFTNEQVYNNTPIGISPAMKSITVKARLFDGNTPVPNSEIEDTFIFIDLGIPEPDKAPGLYTSTQTVKLINNIKAQYPHSKIYYTTEAAGSDFTEYTDDIDQKGITVSQDTTIRARYKVPCGICGNCLSEDFDNCQSFVWGEVGTFSYYRNKSTGGGGGGGYRPPATTDTKKYTIDHFGNEHPYHEKFLNGYPDGSVQGDGNITREETAALLYRVYNKAYTAPTPAKGDKYPDVKINMWSTDAIEYLSDVGMILGYPDGTYMPKNQITRAEFTAMITRWLKLDTDTELSDKDTVFIDTDASHWAYKDICALSKVGYIAGYEDKTFRPEQPITRAEAVTILNRILGRKPDRAYLLNSNFNPYIDLESDKWYYEQVLEATISHYYDLSDTEYKWYLQIK